MRLLTISLYNKLIFTHVVAILSKPPKTINNKINTVGLKLHIFHRKITSSLITIKLIFLFCSKIITKLMDYIYNQRFFILTSFSLRVQLLQELMKKENVSTTIRRLSEQKNESKMR